jgi:glutathione reductase (NADPH)
MSESKTYDLAVIGSGTVAQVASFRLRAAGWSVAVIDHLPFGGTCALRGCDPKKMLINGAEAIDMARRMRGRGVSGELGISWPEHRLAERGIDAFHGKARFAGRTTIEVDGQSIQARHVLIAAGARPVPLTFPGAEHVITSDQFLELDELPARIAMVGGGYIVEFSHIAARAGAKVTVLQRAERMLTRFEPELVGWLMEKFAEIGVEVRTGTVVEAIDRVSNGSRVHARAGSQAITTEAGLVVHAAGRVPDLDGLNLSAAGVAVAEGPSRPERIFAERLQSGCLRGR